VPAVQVHLIGMLEFFILGQAVEDSGWALDPHFVADLLPVEAVENVPLCVDINGNPAARLMPIDSVSSHSEP
jgi:hypothetical protein